MVKLYRVAVILRQREENTGDQGDDQDNEMLVPKRPRNMSKSH